ncbi:MAG: deoxyribose-phosphate aldolase [Eubacteriaceae bacterium]|nr:deoxyribose-phosphate aldolase [Eubacteriaceae bacterium]
MKTLKAADIAKMIDHSLLQPQMTRDEIDEGCEIAAKYSTASVCVRGYDVEYCAKKLQGTDVFVSAVIGFPHGNSIIESKVFETNVTIDAGAKEIDMVIPIGLVLSGEYDYMKREVAAILDACVKKDAILKVIFENAYLTKEQLIECCKICDSLDVHFVKTSTGYAPSGATVEDIATMRKYCKDSIEIKAAGGIRTLDQFIDLYNAGATRQGTRSTAEIIEEAIKRGM